MVNELDGCIGIHRINQKFNENIDSIDLHTRWLRSNWRLSVNWRKEKFKEKLILFADDAT